MPDAPYSVELPSRAAQAFVRASPAVQSAVGMLLLAFLPLHPTAGRRLPRGRLRRLREQGLWQIGLPEGYRLLYSIDQRAQCVRILYLGPTRTALRVAASGPHG